MRAAILLSLLLSLNGAFARGGGHVTTFDPNLFPGATITTLTCNGTSADDTAWSNWRTSSVAANPATALIYVVPGHACKVDITTNCDLTQGIQNAIVWAYGSSVNCALVGNSGFFNDSLHSSLINSANAGDTTVTVNDGTIARYAVGNWIAVTALENQTTGYPPSHLLLEYRRITAIVGNVITVSSPLANSYKSTWPLVQNTNPFLGGPAAIYVMQSAWNGAHQIYGLSFGGTQGAVGFLQRQMSLYDLQFQNGNWLSPTASAQMLLSGVTVQLIEMDKEIDLFNVDKSWIGQISCQTGCANSMTVTSSTLGGGMKPNTFSLQGNTIAGSFISTIISQGSPYDAGARIGSWAAVGSSSIILNDALVKSTSPSIVEIPMANLSFSAGVLSIANNDANYFIAIAWGAPGHTYGFSCHNCGPTISSPLNTFQLSDASSNGTTTSFTMSNCSWGACSGALPTPTCSGSACNYFAAYPFQTVIQTNLRAGSDNIRTLYAP